MSRQSIKNLIEKNKLFQNTKGELDENNVRKAHLSILCTKEGLDEEVEWFESKFTELLNNHAKVIRITANSKRALNDEVAEARKLWAKNIIGKP